MNKKPIVSVVMPVYNCQEYLPEAIESILEQTYQEFEFIIIDDGSTDNTSLILSTFEKKDSRIKVIRQKNQGIVSALNNGIANSQGEYIARMDADDISYPQRIELQVKFMTQNQEVGVVGCFWQIIDAMGKINSRNDYSATTHLEIIWALCSSNPIAHPGVMFRKSAFEKVNGYRELYRHAEDYDLWVRLANEVKYFVIPQPLIFLRKHKENITTVFFQESLNNSIEISRNMVSQILKTPIPRDAILPLWIKQTKEKYESLRCAKLLIRLTKNFQKSYALTKTEKEFFKQETLKKLTGLMHLRFFTIESLKILFLAMQFSAVQTSRIMINKIFHHRRMDSNE